MDITKRVEHHYREMQDMEFTIERDKLWLLQTRDGKRTAQAAVRIAVDLQVELIDHAVEVATPRLLAQSCHGTEDAPTAAALIVVRGQDQIALELELDVAGGRHALRDPGTG